MQALANPLGLQFLNDRQRDKPVQRSRIYFCCFRKDEENPCMEPLGVNRRSSNNSSPLSFQDSSRPERLSMILVLLLAHHIVRLLLCRESIFLYKANFGPLK